MTSALSRLKTSFGRADRDRITDEQQSNLIRDPSQSTVYHTMNLQTVNNRIVRRSPLIQLKSLLWKSWIIRRVHYIATFFEVLCPFLFMLLVCWVISSLTGNFSNNNNNNNDNNDAPIANQTLPPIIYTDRQWLVDFVVEVDFFSDPTSPELSVFYSPDTELSRKLMSPFINARDAQKLPIIVKGFDSEKDVDIQLQLINDKHQAGRSAGIVFNNLDVNDLKNGKFDYEIRMLSDSDMVYRTVQKFPIKTSQAPYDNQEHIKFYSIFTKYQSYIDRQYLYYLCEIYTTVDCKPLYPQAINVYRLPYPEYQNPKISGFSIFDFLGSIVIFSYILYCPLLVRRITEEKSSKARELLRLIGMSDLIYWSSHFIDNFLIIIFQMIGITAVLFSFSSPVITLASPLIVAFVLILFGIQVILFSMTFTTIFNKPIIATIVTSMCYALLNLLISSTLMPSFSQNQSTDTETSNIYRHLASLTPSGSCMFFFSQLGEYENYGIGLNFLNTNRTSTTFDSFTALHTILMMILSIPIYSFLIWYLDNVWPFQEGIPKSPFFLFMKSYYIPSDNQETVCYNNDDNNTEKDDKLFEQNLKDCPTIWVQNITKNFYSGFGNRKTAVDDMCLNIYPNEITVLLGHNGAGKSTTMNMITGMFTPSCGRILVNGFNVSTQTKKARESLSLCPQENIIFTELSVYQHLKLFALLKGSPEDGIDQEIDKVLNLLKLMDKKYEKAVNLSGGMKRKLSLGVALIGPTKTLILDEPTSGMDPDARRVIWDLLKEIRHERTILITTHYMEEADILGDRIAIMNAGKLACFGSPTFLKKVLGTGYRLKIDKLPGFDVEKFLQNIHEYVPEATHESEVGKEVIISLNTKNDGKKLGDKNVEKFPEATPGSEVGNDDKNELMIKFMKLFEYLENNKKESKIDAFSLSYSTLEDVFLSIGSDMKWNNLNDDSLENEPLELSCSNELNSGTELILSQLIALLLKRWNYSRRFLRMFIFQLIVPSLIILLAVNIQNRMFNDVTNKTGSSLVMNTKDVYGESTVSFYYNIRETEVIDQYNNIIINRDKGHTFRIEKQEIPDVAKAILAHVNNDLNEYIRHYLFGVGVDERRETAIWINNEQFHSAPMAFNTYFEALQQTILRSNQSSIKVTSVPMLLAKEKQSFDIVRMALPWIFTSLLFLPIAFPFLSASYIMFPVEENVSKAKLIQLMTKLSPALFWTANFLFDVACHLIAVTLLFAIIFIFDTQGIIFGKDSNNAGAALFILMFVFGISTIPISYILSYRFKKPSSGFVFMVIFFLLFGFLMNLFMSIMDLLRNFIGFTFMDGWYETILSIVRIVPIFSFLFGYQKVYKLSSFAKICDIFSKPILDNMCTNPTGSMAIFQGCCEKCDPCYRNFNPFDMTKYGAGIEVVYMLLTGIICFALILSYEVFKVPVLSRLNKLMSRRQNRTRNGDDSIGLMEAEDHDVEKERARVEEEVQQHNIHDIFTVLHLRKKFGQFTAVSDLTFGVHHGECFGLLGVNGAGKTTTFSMLTGDLIPSSGNAFICDGKHSLVDDLKEFQSRIGYCPQFDALLPLITGEETLYLFARLRGIPKQNIDRDVRNIIRMVGLEKHSNKQVGAYSGGNKRKLSIAVALIGNPMVLFLDEPSAGVDPAARRKIWQTLGYLKKKFNCSIILTSHSMEECEALCDRLGIMVNGRFRCMGNSTHLRERHGQGYSVIISTTKELSNDSKYIETIKTEIVRCLPSAVLKDFHQGLLQFHITDPKEKWSNIFRQMVTLNEMLKFEDYHVSETTLEQIFLMFARHQKADPRA